MTIGLIFTLVAVVYMLGLAAIYLFAARKKNWIMTTVRIGVTIVSAVASIPLTKVLAKLAAGFVYDFILPRLGTKAESFLDAVPVGAESVRVIIAVVAAPILYLAVFLLVRGLLSIGAWIVEKCVPILKKRSPQAISMPFDRDCDAGSSVRISGVWRSSARYLCG